MVSVVFTISKNTKPIQAVPCSPRGLQLLLFLLLPLPKGSDSQAGLTTPGLVSFQQTSSEQPYLPGTVTGTDLGWCPLEAHR